MRKPIRVIAAKQSTKGYTILVKQWPKDEGALYDQRFSLVQHDDLIAVATREDLIVLRDAIDTMIERTTPKVSG